MRDVRRIGGGRGLRGGGVGGREKSGWGVSWTTSESPASTPTSGLDDCSPGRGEMAQRTERLMANEMDRCTENQGRTTACSISSMPECDGKGQGEDRMAQSKRARGGSLAIVDGPQLSGANLYPPGVWFADATSSFSGVTFVFVLLCFRRYAFTVGKSL